MIIEILKDDEVYQSFDDTTLKAAKLRAELLTRDNDGEFTARVKPEPEPEDAA